MKSFLLAAAAVLATVTGADASMSSAENGTPHGWRARRRRDSRHNPAGLRESRTRYRGDSRTEKGRMYRRRWMV